MSGSRTRIGLLISFFGMVSLFAMAGARASVINDVPTALAQALGITDFAARQVLSVSVLLSVGLGLSMVSKRGNFLMTIAGVIGVMGVMIAIGWMDYWYLFLIGMVVAIMFGSNFAKWLAGS